MEKKTSHLSKEDNISLLKAFKKEAAGKPLSPEEQELINQHAEKEEELQEIVDVYSTGEPERYEMEVKNFKGKTAMFNKKQSAYDPYNNGKIFEALDRVFGNEVLFKAFLQELHVGQKFEDDEYTYTVADLIGTDEIELIKTKKTYKETGHSIHTKMKPETLFEKIKYFINDEHKLLDNAKEFTKDKSENALNVSKQIENFLSNKENRKTIITILQKKDLIIGTHGSEVINPETREFEFKDKSDFDGELTATLIKIANLDVKETIYLPKGLKKVEQLNGEKKPSIIFDTGEEGQAIRLVKYFDGTDALIFGNHYTDKIEKSSSAYIWGLIVKNLEKDASFKIDTSELHKEYVQKSIDFANNIDNLILTKQLIDRFKEEDLKEVLAKTLYGQYKNLSVNEILKHLKTKNDYEDLDKDITSKKITVGKYTKSLFEFVKSRIDGSIKGIEKAEKEMEANNYKLELPELGRVLVNHDTTSKVKAREILHYFGFDSNITFMENGIFISAPTNNLEKSELLKKLQERFDSNEEDGDKIIIANSMIMYFPKKNQFNKQEWVDTLELVDNNKEKREIKNSLKVDTIYIDELGQKINIKSVDRDHFSYTIENNPTVYTELIENFIENIEKREWKKNVLPLDTFANPESIQKKLNNNGWTDYFIMNYLDKDDILNIYTNNRIFSEADREYYENREMNVLNKEIMKKEKELEVSNQELKRMDEEISNLIKELNL